MNMSNGYTMAQPVNEYDPSMVSPVNGGICEQMGCIRRATKKCHASLNSIIQKLFSPDLTEKEKGSDVRCFSEALAWENQSIEALAEKLDELNGRL